MNRSEFRKKVGGIFSKEEVAFIMFAYDLSKAAHRNQIREEFSEDTHKDEKRYFNHPRIIANRMIDDGIRDYEVICEALLHDSYEDSSLFGNQRIDGYDQAMFDARFRLERAFNKAIAEDVISLTIPQKIENDKRFKTKTQCLFVYHGKLLVASTKALFAKLYDRLHNLESIEVKGKDTALLKLKETEEFYIPLFEKTFERQETDIEKIGYRKTLELKELVIRKKEEITTFFINKHGKVKVGERVSFRVENQDDWAGDNQGVLIFEDDLWKIVTAVSGTLTIDKGRGPYHSSIKKLN